MTKSVANQMLSEGTDGSCCLHIVLESACHSSDEGILWYIQQANQELSDATSMILYMLI